MANLSAIFACLGINSQRCIPGTLVLMGLNSPQYSLGALGFISYMSRCEGPPLRWIMMTDFCLDLPGAGDSARKRRTSPRVSPLSVRAPTRRKLRRVIPGRFAAERGSWIVSMWLSLDDVWQQDACYLACSDPASNSLNFWELASYYWGTNEISASWE